MSALEFNNKFFGYDDLYYKVAAYGYHLPPLENLRYCLNAKQLLNIINGECYVPKRSNVNFKFLVNKKMNSNEV